MPRIVPRACGARRWIIGEVVSTRAVRQGCIRACLSARILSRNVVARPLREALECLVYFDRELAYAFCLGIMFSIRGFLRMGMYIKSDI